MELAREVLTTYAAVTSAAPEELSVWAWLFNFPPIPDIPEPLRGGSFVAIDATYLGDAEAAEELLRPLRDVAAPIFDTMGTVPIGALGDVAMEPVDPVPAMEYSTLLTGFDATTIDDLLAVAGPGTNSPLLLVEIRHLGGALSRSGEQHGAVGAVAEPYVLFSVGVPMVPELEVAVEHRFGLLADVLAGHSSGRTLFNWLGSDLNPRRAFSPETLHRLQAIKSDRDPAGILRSNRPVLDAGAPDLPRQR
jgi:hypothetical protein